MSPSTGKGGIDKKLELFSFADHLLRPDEILTPFAEGLKANGFE
jgi:hypothetical protein